jgi:hypothetical protein
MPVHPATPCTRSSPMEIDSNTFSGIVRLTRTDLPNELPCRVCIRNDRSILAIRGTCGIVGAPVLGTDASGSRRRATDYRHHRRRQRAGSVYPASCGTLQARTVSVRQAGVKVHSLDQINQAAKDGERKVPPSHRLSDQHHEYLKSASRSSKAAIYAALVDSLLVADTKILMIRRLPAFLFV